MKKLKYIKPEAEVVHFHLMDGDLYTLSGGQNGNETGGGATPLTTASFNGNLGRRQRFCCVCFLCLRQKCEVRAAKIQNTWITTHKNRKNHEK